MLSGECRHTVDAKGRMIVPVKFREDLGNTFVVTRGLDGCLFAYSMDQWRLFLENMHQNLDTGKKSRTFSRFFIGGAEECEMDKQGRILLTPELREFAGITKDVVSVGLGDRVEIWDKEKFDKELDFSGMEDIAEEMSSLGIRF